MEPLLKITLRPATEKDRKFLQRVYASTREVELSQVPWNQQEKDNFLAMQFRAQDAYYKEHYANATFDIIVAAGEPVGRLYVERYPDEIRIIDIALLTEHRRKGIGSYLLKNILTEGETTQRPVSIHVEYNNPAMGLYHWLGFKKIEERGVYHFLKWTPEKQTN